eukprot:167485_1
MDTFEANFDYANLRNNTKSQLQAFCRTLGSVDTGDKSKLIGRIKSKRNTIDKLYETNRSKFIKRCKREDIDTDNADDMKLLNILKHIPVSDDEDESDNYSDENESDNDNNNDENKESDEFDVTFQCRDVVVLGITITTWNSSKWKCLKSVTTDRDKLCKLIDIGWDVYVHTLGKNNRTICLDSGIFKAYLQKFHRFLNNRENYPDCLVIAQSGHATAKGFVLSDSVIVSSLQSHRCIQWIFSGNVVEFIIDWQDGCRGIADMIKGVDTKSFPFGIKPPTKIQCRQILKQMIKNYVNKYKHYSKKTITMKQSLKTLLQTYSEQYVSNNKQYPTQLLRFIFYGCPTGQSMEQDVMTSSIVDVILEVAQKGAKALDLAALQPIIDYHMRLKTNDSVFIRSNEFERVISNVVFILGNTKGILNECVIKKGAKCTSQKLKKWKLTDDEAALPFKNNNSNNKNKKKVVKKK